jgi:hypothetical protein
MHDACRESRWDTWLHYNSTLRDDIRKLGSRISCGDYGSTTGKHPNQFRWHDEVGHFSLLRQDVKIGDVQQFIYSIRRLQMGEMHVR